MRLNKLQKVAVAALEEVKGQDILVLDVRKLTSMCDSMIIASAQSTRQVKALADNVRDRLREAGASIIGVEGELSSEWVLVDCGDIVVHVMQPAVRAHYKLEELWTAPLARKRAVGAAAARQPAADDSGGAVAA
jgi:ribosome-associated protein